MWWLPDGPSCSAWWAQPGPSVAEQVSLAGSAEIAMGITGISGFMDVYLLRNSSRAIRTSPVGTASSGQ